jgi:hypothetical protein
MRFYALAYMPTGVPAYRAELTPKFLGRAPRLVDKLSSGE